MTTKSIHDRARELEAKVFAAGQSTAARIAVIEESMRETAIGGAAAISKVEINISGDLTPNQIAHKVAESLAMRAPAIAKLYDELGEGEAVEICASCYRCASIRHANGRASVGYTDPACPTHGTKSAPVAAPAGLYERAVQPLQAILLEVDALGASFERLTILDASARASRAAIGNEAKRLVEILRGGQAASPVDELKVCTGCGVHESATPERTLFGGLCGKCDAAGPTDLVVNPIDLNRARGFLVSNFDAVPTPTIERLAMMFTIARDEGVRGWELGPNAHRRSAAEPKGRELTLLRAARDIFMSNRISDLRVEALRKAVNLYAEPVVPLRIVAGASPTDDKKVPCPTCGTVLTCWNGFAHLEARASGRNGAVRTIAGMPTMQTAGDDPVTRHLASRGPEVTPDGHLELLRKGLLALDCNDVEEARKVLGGLLDGWSWGRDKATPEAEAEAMRIARSEERTKWSGVLRRWAAWCREAENDPSGVASEGPPVVDPAEWKHRAEALENAADVIDDQNEEPFLVDEETADVE